MVTSSDTHKVYGFFSALSSSETLFLPVRNCKQLLYRSLHGLPHKNRCLGYLLLLLLTFLHHVVVTVRRLPCRPMESIEMRKQRLQTFMGQHTFPSDYKCRFQATRTKSVKRFSTFNVSLWSKLFSSNILTLVASCSK